MQSEVDRERARDREGDKDGPSFHFIGSIVPSCSLNQTSEREREREKWRERERGRERAR